MRDGSTDSANDSANDLGSRFTPGWYPDPAGAHELRYHNGSSWTGDVASDGHRSVAPLSAPRSSADADRSSKRALTLGVISMCVGWVPFVSVPAFGVAVAAIVLALRARSRASSAESATAALVTGAVGIVFAIGGTWAALAIVGAVERFDDPGPHEVSDLRCQEVDGVTRASGSITNLDDRVQSYTVEIDWDAERSTSVEVDDVAPGATTTFEVDEDLRFDELTCEVTAVNGPRPFGLDLTS